MSATGPATGGPGELPGVVPGFRSHLVPGFRAAKEYRCPTCSGVILPGVGHVVAWPEGLEEQRRHWHRHCWRLAVRRGRVTAR